MMTHRQCLASFLATVLFVCSCQLQGGQDASEAAAPPPSVPTIPSALVPPSAFAPPFALSSPSLVPDTRTPAQIAQAACTASDGTWRCKTAKPVVLASSGAPPITPVSWSVPQWYVDPSNSSGNASDSNGCTTTGAPCLSFAQIVSRWGTNAPIFSVNVILTWLSSATASTDFINVAPSYLSSGVLNINASLPTATFTGTLGTVTTKSTTAPTGNALQSTFTTATGAVAANMLLVNSTHASRAWAQKIISGSNWQISQPLVAYPGSGFPSVTEVNTWTSGDTIIGYVPLSVNISHIGGAYGAAGNNYIWQVTIPNTLARFDGSTLNYCLECDIGSGVVSTTGGGVLTMVNSIAPSAAPFQYGGPTTVQVGIYAGYIHSLQALSLNPSSGSVVVGTDTILTGTPVFSGVAGFAPIFLDTGVTLTVIGGATIGFSGSLYYGPGTLNVGAGGTVYYSGTATTTFANTTLQLNGVSTGYSLATSAGVTTVHGGISLTAANLNASAGAAGFGNYAFGGGGAYTNAAQP
jgi:hypothetical protein